MDHLEHSLGQRQYEDGVAAMFFLLVIVATLVALGIYTVVVNHFYPFIKRGFKHRSSLDKRQARGKAVQNVYLQTLSEQKKILKKRNCLCLRN